MRLRPLLWPSGSRWHERYRPELLLFAAALLLLAVPKLLTGFEFGDGLPYHIGQTVQMANSLEYALAQPQPPLFYYLLIPLWLLSKSFLVVGLLAPLCASALVALSYRVLSRHLPRAVAFAAALLLLTTGDFVSISASTHLEPFTSLWLLLSFHLLTSPAPRFLRLAPRTQAALAFALAQLSKYSAIAFYPVAVGIEYLREKRLDRAFALRVAAFVVIALILASPLYLKNLALYGNPLHPRATGSALTDVAYTMAVYGGPARYLLMTYDSYYFSNTNVGDYFPEQARFAHGSLLFDWGFIASIPTPGGRAVGIHIFDALAAGALSLLLLIGLATLFQRHRRFFWHTLNILFWFGALYLLYSLAPNSAPSTRFILFVYPFLSAAAAAGLWRFRSKKWWPALLALAALSALYLYALQLDRMLVFAQHAQEAFSHPYIQETVLQYIR